MALDIITADNQVLKEQLVLENRFTVQPGTQLGAATLAELQGEADILVKRVRRGQSMWASGFFGGKGLGIFLACGW